MRSKCRLLLAVLLAAVLAGTAFAVKDPFRVLGVGKESSVDEIKRSYKKLAIKYHPDKNPTASAKARFLEIQAAYETLTDPEKRRNFDETGFADPQEAARHGHRGMRQGGAGGFGHPFFQRNRWQPPPPPPRLESATFAVTPLNVDAAVLRSGKAWLLQIYYDYSDACRHFAPQWESLAKDMEGIARLGRVDYAAHRRLAAQLAPRSWLSPEPILQPYSLPVFVAIGPDCDAVHCGRRYEGDPDASKLESWVLDTVLRLPQVPEIHSLPLLKSHFLATAPAHKARVLAISPRSAPSALLRKLAAEHAPHLAFARARWTPDTAAAWSTEYGVSATPALLFFEGALGGAARPYHVALRATGKAEVASFVAAHRLPPVIPLRRSTASVAGCAPAGGGRTPPVRYPVWCVVALGKLEGGNDPRPGPALASALVALRSTAAMLMSENGPAGRARAASRLQLTWLDAATQSAFCNAHFGADACAAALSGAASPIAVLRFEAAGCAPSAFYGGALPPAVDGGTAGAGLLAWLGGIVSAVPQVLPRPECEPLADEDAPSWPAAAASRLVAAGSEGLKSVRTAWVRFQAASGLEHFPLGGDILALLLVLLVLSLPVLQLIFAASAAENAPPPPPNAPQPRPTVADAVPLGPGATAGVAGTVFELTKDGVKSVGERAQGLYLVMLLYSPAGAAADIVRRYDELQEVKQLARDFRGDLTVAFVTLDSAAWPAWGPTAASESRDAEGAGGIAAGEPAGSPIVCWHPKRHKYVRLGACGGDPMAVAGKLEMVLSGTVGQWQFPPLAFTAMGFSV